MNDNIKGGDLMAMRKKEPAETAEKTLDDLKQEAVLLGLRLCHEVQEGTARDVYKNVEAVRNLIEVLK